MRPLKSHFRDDALTTLDTVLKQTKEARVFRRAQAVREVAAGHHVNAVSAMFRFTNSALRKWVQRFAQQGSQGLLDRPRTGRPPKMTCELERHLQRLRTEARDVGEQPLVVEEQCGRRGLHHQPEPAAVGLAREECT